MIPKPEDPTQFDPGICPHLAGPVLRCGQQTAAMFGNKTYRCTTVGCPMAAVPNLGLVHDVVVVEEPGTFSLETWQSIVGRMP